MVPTTIIITRGYLRFAEYVNPLLARLPANEQGASDDVLMVEPLQAALIAVLVANSQSSQDGPHVFDKATLGTWRLCVPFAAPTQRLACYAPPRGAPVRPRR